MSKKILLSIIAMICIFSSTVFAATTKVQINGEIIDFTDSNGAKVEAQIINDRTMVPLRKIFEILGCDIEWINDTKTVIAEKNDTKITLQINNKTATKVINEKEEKITLDAAPTIVDDRTLVPLRFIAESLNKQVGWDSAERTAIIIDYDYFTNKLLKDAPMFAGLLNSKDKEIILTRTYHDKLDSKNDNTFTVKGIVKNQAQNLSVQFDGTNDLAKEIKSENWNNIDFNLQYLNDGIKYSTPSTTVAKMLAITTDTPQNVKYKDLNLENLTNVNVFQGIINVPDNKLKVNTFKDINNEFNKILSRLNYKNSGNGIATFSMNNVQTLDFKYFDITKFDNIVLNNDISKIYNFINKMFFNYDIELDELLYDMTTIKLDGSCSENYIIMKLTLLNDYDEEFIYDLKINF